jgi:hypothetical protein
MNEGPQAHVNRLYLSRLATIPASAWDQSLANGVKPSDALLSNDAALLMRSSRRPLTLLQLLRTASGPE